MLAPPPHALDVDAHGQIPDPLLGVHRIVVVGVHDARVVEHDVHAAPGVQVGDGGRDFGFARDVAGKGFDALCGRVEGGEDGVDFGEGGGKGGGGDVGHQDRRTLAEEEDGGFEADAAGRWLGKRPEKLTKR